MTRDEYNEAHRQLERDHRSAHRRNRKVHGRPAKFVDRKVSQALTTAYYAWRRTPAAKAWGDERTTIFARFKAAHLALKEAHPEFCKASAA